MQESGESRVVLTTVTGPGSGQIPPSFRFELVELNEQVPSVAAVVWMGPEGQTGYDIWPCWVDNMCRQLERALSRHLYLGLEFGTSVNISDTPMYLGALTMCYWRGRCSNPLGSWWQNMTLTPSGWSVLH